MTERKMWILRSLNSFILILIIQLSHTVISSEGGEGTRHNHHHSSVTTGDTIHPMSVHRHSHLSPLVVEEDQSSRMNYEPNHHINRLRSHHSPGRSNSVETGVNHHQPTDFMTPDSSMMMRETYHKNNRRPVGGTEELRTVPSHNSIVKVHNEQEHGEEFPGVTTDEPISPNATVKPEITKKPRWCMNRKILDQCLAQVPPMPDIGIPSSSEAVQTACKAFNVGMGCVDSWSKKCLNPDTVKRFQESISGAHETFAFLCRDSKFRMAFLKHGDCFKKISPKWDECSRHFIEDMKRHHYNGNTSTHCCIRIMFLQCVAGIGHLHCDRVAASFLQKMAETLIRTTMKTHTPPQCKKYSPQNCTYLNSSPAVFEGHGISPTFSVVGSVVISCSLYVLSTSLQGPGIILEMLLTGLSSVFGLVMIRM